jgi:hypothetical protein
LLTALIAPHVEVTRVHITDEGRQALEAQYATAKRN